MTRRYHAHINFVRLDLVFNCVVLGVGEMIFPKKQQKPRFCDGNIRWTPRSVLMKLLYPCKCVPTPLRLLATEEGKPLVTMKPGPSWRSHSHHLSGNRNLVNKISVSKSSRWCSLALILHPIALKEAKPGWHLSPNTKPILASSFCHGPTWRGLERGKMPSALGPVALALLPHLQP